MALAGRWCGTSGAQRLGTASSFVLLNRLGTTITATAGCTGTRTKATILELDAERRRVGGLYGLEVFDPQAGLGVLRRLCPPVGGLPLHADLVLRRGLLGRARRARRGEQAVLRRGPGPCAARGHWPQARRPIIFLSELCDLAGCDRVRGCRPLAGGRGRGRGLGGRGRSSLTWCGLCWRPGTVVGGGA